MAADEAVALDGVPIVEINPERTAVSYVLDVKINGAAAEVLDDIWERLPDVVAVYLIRSDHGIAPRRRTH